MWAPWLRTVTRSYSPQKGINSDGSTKPTQRAISPRAVVHVRENPMAPLARTDQTSARVNQLVELNLPLVGHLVRETLARVPAHVNRDDLTSAAMMALVVAAQGFDAERGVPFARYAAIRIRGGLTGRTAQHGLGGPLGAQPRPRGRGRPHPALCRPAPLPVAGRGRRGHGHQHRRTVDARRRRRPRPGAQLPGLRPGVRARRGPGARERPGGTPRAARATRLSARGDRPVAGSAAFRGHRVLLRAAADGRDRRTNSASASPASRSCGPTP